MIYNRKKKLSGLSMYISKWIMWTIAKSHCEFFFSIFLQSSHHQVDRHEKCSRILVRFYMYFNTLEIHIVWSSFLVSLPSQKLLYPNVQSKFADTLTITTNVISKRDFSSCPKWFNSHNVERNLLFNSTHSRLILC